MGLDEAGRGCVLGPLVVGCFVVDEERLGDVVAAGATDSKRLTRRRREAILPALRALGTAEVAEIPVEAIDGGNLNHLEERTFLDFIRAHRPDAVIIDAPCHPAAIGALVARLEAGLPYRPRWTVAPKADLDWPACGAASIAAKVHRDRQIDGLGPVGSGYPSDPVTRAWIRGFFERGEPLPACVRRRWDTVRQLEEEVRSGRPLGAFGRPPGSP